MQLTAILIGLLTVSCAALQDEDDVGYEGPGTVKIYLGQRSLDEDDWDPVEDQRTLGLEFVLGEPTGFGWAVGGWLSADDDAIGGIDAEVDTGEIYGGAQKTFGSYGSWIRPYVGGGLTYILAHVDSGFGEFAEHGDDQSIGAYAHGGLRIDVSQGFFVGFDLRAVFGTDVDIGGFDTDVDYQQVTFVLGFEF